MNRNPMCLILATMIVLMVTIKVDAQGRASHGGHVSGGARGFSTPASPAFSGHPGGFAGRGPIVNRGPVVRPSPVFRSPFIGRPRTVVVPSFGFYSPYFWDPFASPFYGSPYYGSASTFYNPPYAASTGDPSPVIQYGNTNSNADLSYQVQKLSDEIEQLRADQSAQASRQSQPAPAQTPTVLVFRDGHEMTVQNYAVVGQTLWVLDENSSTKIAISDLDLDATQRENRGRGVRFPLPK